MKSPYQIAKELNVTPQSVYQKIERIEEQLDTHIHRNGKKMLIDEQGETLIKSTFQTTVEQEPQQDIEQELLKQLNNQLNTENEFLRKQNTNLLEDLNKEREHSRQQAQSLSELSDKLAELTKNEQILMLQYKNTLLLSDERPPDESESDGNNKKTLSIWQRIFKQKK